MAVPRLVGPRGENLETPEIVAQDDFKISSNFDVGSGLGAVVLRVPGLDQPLHLIPAEAKLLGVSLIVESETAIGTAMMLRTLLGMGEDENNPMPIEQAVGIMQALSRQVRGSQAVQYEMWYKRRMEQAEMKKEGSHGQSEPS